MTNLDFGKTAKDYRLYRQGFPAEFFKRLTLFGIGKQGQRVLDLGTGTGTVARGLALEGCEVTGIDPTASLLEQAKLLDQEQGVSIQYELASAEDTKQATHNFDVVTAGQCWHWFKAEQAIVEIKRVLKPKAKLVIAHNDWLSDGASVPALSKKLIMHYNPQSYFGAKGGFYIDWVAQLSESGFENIETFSFDYVAEYSHEGWCGRIRAFGGIAKLEPEQISQFDKEHMTLLNKQFPDEPLKIAHRCFVIVASLK
ncbi:MAG: class I SAM-dependent methyltransferase [Gammaproteobacteria bacterium]|nr:class I SAM-dependent methyltransferase [Gammaproteobacteria bacterium]